jgi:hypothetical protein
VNNAVTLIAGVNVFARIVLGVLDSHITRIISFGVGGSIAGVSSLKRGNSVQGNLAIFRKCGVQTPIIFTGFDGGIVTNTLIGFEEAG